MSDQALVEIHSLMKSDLNAANQRLLFFARKELQLPFQVFSAELRPSAVSLNSISGILETSAGKKFFKTHIEPSSIINEYYKAHLLEEAGYPVIPPIFSSTEYGKQFLIYDFFSVPSVFDIVRALDRGKRKDEKDFISAMRASDAQLMQLYAKTLKPLDAAKHAEQPIHQLFLHRLTGPRLKEFYGGQFPLMNDNLSFADLAEKHWVVNGSAYGTLQGMIDGATKVLAFEGPNPIASVTGHGDAHAGNLFYFGAGKPLTHFDPAFAGIHSPLLDVIKPMIHNTWLKWLYFPEEVAQECKVTYRMTDAAIEVEYTFQPSKLRVALFESKLKQVVGPTIKLMEEQGLKPQNWQEIIQAASMCCPLLVMNLSNRDRFPPSIGLLGLAMAAEMGGKSENRAQPGWFQKSLQSAVS